MDHSYGLQVARLAGLPDHVIARAREILTALEINKEGRQQTAAAQEKQLSLFEPNVVPENAALKKLLTELEETDIMTTTPLEAMHFLQRLQQAVKKGNLNG